VAIPTQCGASDTLCCARRALSDISLTVASSGAAIAVRTAFKRGTGSQRHMGLETEIWTRSRRSINAAALILALSISGWAQQATSTSQKHQAPGRQAGTIEYRNGEYGFRIVLPESWKGYRVLWSEWQGSVQASNGAAEHVLRGPRLRLRHPKWTEENPREDMPIMIFTIAQWNESPIVSAAPFGPGELGRNGQFVFAVPPRWDYDFAEGYEEAEKILTPASLHTFAPGK
jgi:hypothetical protein